jgi:hypothetical protein
MPWENVIVMGNGNDIALSEKCFDKNERIK